MARIKGSRIINGKVVNPVAEKGNPLFNLTEVEPSQTIGQDIAPGAIMPEDLELDRQLEAMSHRPEMAIEREPAITAVTLERNQRGEMLSEVMADYKPADSDESFRVQIDLALVEKCNSIEATLQTAKRYCKDPRLEEVGYFIYHNVKVYIVGSRDMAQRRDAMTIEQKVHYGGRSNATV